MKYRYFFLLVSACAHARQVSVTLFNKSNEQIVASVQPCTAAANKQAIPSKQSKKFMIPSLTEHQSACVTLERSGAYWPHTYEIKVMAASQVVLKRDSLVVSTKFSKGKTVACNGPLKLGYFGTTPPAGKQEIMFI